MKKMILMRHGQSTWNQLNKFTGWYDAPLTLQGIKEAKHAACLLKKNNLFFDYAYTSVLKRAIHTLQYILEELDQSWVPIKKSWRLNERHYGALEGLNKDEVIQKYGEKQVLLWRRSFQITPPKIHVEDKRFPGHDIRYKNMNTNDIPLGESLQTTAMRVIPYWHQKIYPQLKKNKKILIVAHGNSLRALIQYLNKIDNEKILQVNIPTGIPIVLKFNEQHVSTQWHYLV